MKNTRQVLDAWRQDRAYSPCPAIWTDGTNIFSYGTCILADNGDRKAMNVTRYSVTTTIHQNAIRSEVHGVWPVDGMPMGCSPAALLNQTYEQSPTGYPGHDA